MIDLIKDWYHRKFSDPDAIALVVILLLGFFVIYFLGHLLAPLLVAIILAYLLDWPIIRLQRIGFGRRWATSLVLLTFFVIVIVAMVRLLPTIWTQAMNLLSEIPTMVNQGQTFLDSLPKRYPELIDPAFIDTFSSLVHQRMLGVGEKVVQASLSSLVSLAALAVYCILVPLMLFFLLNDKRRLLHAATKFLPKNRVLAGQVWREMHQQIINYLRGKAIEIIVVGVATYLVFVIMGMRYSALLGFAVGLSVLIPYIGAFAVTVPVTMVALFQWGLTPEFGYLMVGYLVVQALDGNLLVPLLFSEAVNLHPLAIITAVLFFGGLWGFWGIFFAIPLATLVKAVLNAWPSDTLSRKHLIES